MKYYFEILEFNKIIPIIKKYLKTYPGKKELDNIYKIIELRNADSELKISEQMAHYLQYDSSISFEELNNIEESIKNSKIKHYAMNSDEVLEIKKVFGIYKDIYNSLVPYSEKYSLLFNLIKDITLPEKLISSISKVMDDEGAILDSASDELKRIRKRKSSVRIDIHSALTTLIEKKSLKEAVQEKFITIRDGRFVIPIKVQYKNKLKSEFNYVVHSFSKTGETSFVEPENIIELNNEIVEIDDVELKEINRILISLTELISEQSDIIMNIYFLIGRLELIYAKAKFAIEYHCCFPEIIRDKACLRLRKARHPLLGVNSIPVDIEIGFSCQGLVISGPNAGGKTVALKTAGLLTLMALCGIPIPAARDSQIGYFSKIMAEIGDEQNISENLSSFSGHIVSISRMLKDCDKDSLILIDEIASSTEPKEGEALGRAIILSIINKGAGFIITTHFQALKEISYSFGKVKNAAVDFDEEKLMPLYSLRTGTSGSSYALRIAKKYGLDDNIIKNAEIYLNEKYSSIEKLMKSLESERNELIKRKIIIEKNIEESRNIKSNYDKILKEVEEEKKALQKKGIHMLRQELDDALKELALLKSELKKKTMDSVKKVQEDIKGVQKFLKDSEEKILKDERRHPKEISTGQKIFVGSFKKEGYIEQILGDKFKVRLGIISTIVELNDIYLTENDSNNYKASTRTILENTSAAPLSIDVRGHNAEEALKVVEKNIDLAYMKGASTLSIIHGKGEGILRREIWNFLQKQDSIRSFNYAKPEEGGQGKTIIFFK